MAELRGSTDSVPASGGGPAPASDRPIVPSEYGIPATTRGLLDWSHVDRRLRDAMVYWVATSGPGGRPRVRPLDGLWVGGALWVGGSPETRWVRDLRENPQVAVHLDDGSDVAILEGLAEFHPGAAHDLADELAAVSRAKYPQYEMTAAQYMEPGSIVIRPTVAFAWTSFPQDVTRFRW